MITHLDLVCHCDFQSCIDTFCDAKSIVSATIPDLMICASWAGDMLGKQVQESQETISHHI